MSTPASRPTLKLKLSTSSHVPTLQNNDSPASGSTPKIKLKVGSFSKPSTPAESPPSAVLASKSEKKAKKAKSTVRVVSNGTSSSGAKKRNKPGDEDDDGPRSSKPQLKKLKLKHRGPVTPIIRAKLKGKPPARPLGVGYDSESSDREIDPHIEEEFVLRMLPGEDCDYLRKAIEEKKIGLSKREGGADVSMKFLNREGRRAIVTIRGRHYAATMVDLPCVVDGMKSWDRRGWWKSADICQLLLVTGQIATEDMALTMPLPPQVDPKTYQYPHGLTPPMYNVRKNRFRKRVSNKTIEAVEDEVERLLAADRDCEPGTSVYEVVDLDRMTRDNSVAPSDEGGYNMLGNAGMQEADYEDAEGEVDEQSYYEDGYAEDGEGLEAHLEQAMMEDDDEAAETPATEVAVPLGAIQDSLTGVAPTPEAVEESEDESSDGDEGDEDDDEERADDIDEDTLAQQKDLAKQQEEVADLENAINSETAKLETMTNPLFRARQLEKIRSLKSDLDLKRGAAEEEED